MYYFFLFSGKLNSLQWNVWISNLNHFSFHVEKTCNSNVLLWRHGWYGYIISRLKLILCHWNINIFLFIYRYFKFVIWNRLIYSSKSSNYITNPTLTLAPPHRATIVAPVLIQLLLPERLSVPPGLPSIETGTNWTRKLLPK